MKIYIPCRRYNVGGKKITINHNGITYVLAKEKTVEIPDFLLKIIQKIEPLTKIVTACDEYYQKWFYDSVMRSLPFYELLKSGDLSNQKIIKFRKYNDL